MANFRNKLYDSNRPLLQQQQKINCKQQGNNQKKNEILPDQKHCINNKYITGKKITIIIICFSYD